jgi:hypothetical protein
MTAADQEALRSAAVLHRGLARAASVARTNGLGYAVFGALTLLLALPGLDVADSILGAVLLAVGIAQRRTAPRIRRADPTAPLALARNELVLMAAIAVYCGLMLTLLRPSAAQWRTELDAAGGAELGLGELADSLTTATYAALLAVTLLYQGGLALYFLRRRPLLERYLAGTPAWARAALEAMDP